MAHADDHANLDISSPGKQATMSSAKEYEALPHASPLSPSHERIRFPDYDDGDQRLANLTNLRIDDSRGAGDIQEQATKEAKAGEQRDGRHDDGDELFFAEHKVVFDYFYKSVPVAQELQELRQKGWNSTEGDKYFEKQKYHTDHADRKTSQNFMNMMRTVADKMHAATSIFTLPARRPTILAFGFAPGGFVEKALALNPTAEAIGITLSDKLCGIPILVKSKRLTFHPADITLMAADLGLAVPDDVPQDHPDAARFLPKLIRPRALFDLVTVEGGVLRPHQALVGAHREHREAHRLAAAQLALALSRVKIGGSMIVLLHKPETWNSLSLFYLFSKFAQIELFKPSDADGRAPHQYKSSFYLVAKNVQSQSEVARIMVKQWTREWKAATFGTGEEYEEVVREHALDVDQVLEEFGKEWIELGREVWVIQRNGLRQKEFTKGDLPEDVAPV